ncbi:MAG: hypothetical protein V2A61_04335 [Calditrichota bacterium]
MFDRILKRMRDCINEQNYTMTGHAHDKAMMLDLTALDIETTILCGRIIEQQKDVHTSEAK